MQNIAAIILTFNEEIHLKRCIDSILPITKEIFVVDCFSTDKTIEIAELMGAKVFRHKWENSYAKQLNWALSNLPVTSEWILRLDADEYLLPELVSEINNKIQNIPENITGIICKRRHYFLGKWIKKGTYPVKLLRLFRYGKGFCEQRWMDEHIELTEGESIEFKHDFVDYNLNNLGWWIQKHNGYSVREAIDLLDVELNLLAKNENELKLNGQALEKRKKKIKYSKMPLFLRSFIYFLYRYFLKFGFLEGKEAFLWHFLQGWWYRTLVDVKIFEIKKACGTDKNKIKEFIRIQYGVDVDVLGNESI